MSQYAPQASDQGLSEATIEEIQQAVYILNAVSKSTRRIDPKKAGNLSTMEEKRVAIMFTALRQARGLAAQYVYDTCMAILTESKDLAEAKAKLEAMG